ncbi:MAG: flagellar biosynthetic protein FliP, partial [Nitrospirales bacterium]
MNHFFCGFRGGGACCRLLGMSLVMGLPTSAFAQATKDPAISLQVSGLDGTEPWTFGLRILFLLTALTLAPALLMLVTAFTRVVIVLGLLRQALGTMHAPPNQVMIGLAMFLTLFIMMPVWEQIRVEALNPLLEQQVTQEVALDRAKIPIRTFMLKQVREKDLTLFVEMAKVPHPQTPDDVPFHV